MDGPQENSAKTYLKLDPSTVQMVGSVFIQASQSLRTDQQLMGAGGGRGVLQSWWYRHRYVAFA